MTIERYLKAREGNVTKTTLESHGSALRTMFKQMGVAGDGEPTPDDFRKWMMEKKGDMKHTTTSVYCSILKNYWKTMGLDGLDEVQNTIDTMKPSVSTSDHEHGEMSEEQVWETIRSAKEPFDLAYCLAYCYGRRLGEVMLLEAGDVELDEGEIVWSILKKKTVRKVAFPLHYLPDRWRERLEERVREVEEGRLWDYPVGTIQYHFRRATRVAETDELAHGTHTLRHSRVRHLRKRGVSWEAIRELTRHENLSILFDIYGRRVEAKDEVVGAEEV